MELLCKRCEKETRLPWHHTYGRECYRAVDRKRYYANREKRLKKDRVRYTKLTPEQKRARYESAFARGPEKMRARQAVRNAITAGKLVRLPCEECGTTPSHAHHYKGYALENWFAINWLCKQHHYEKHRLY